MTSAQTTMTSAQTTTATSMRPIPAPGMRDADVSSLLHRWQAEGDRGAREALVERFMPLSRKLARRYIRSSEPYDDLLQVASLALLKAIDRFDAGRGVAFASFAVPTILGELRRYFRDCAWAVHVPRGAQERALAVDYARDQLTSAHGRSPTVQEIGARLELTAEEVLAAMQTARAYTTVSLDAPSRTDDDGDASFGALMGQDDERFELLEADITLRAALPALSDRERRILHLRFVSDMSQSEIAAEVGLSQMQVSRILRSSLERLREITGAADQTPEEHGAARLRSVGAAAA